MTSTEPFIHPSNPNHLSSSDHNQLYHPTSLTPSPAGTQPIEHYRSQLSAWKFQTRCFLIRRLESEIRLIRSIQRLLRSKPLDWLMVHSSWLGSHSFFTVALSISFWFGHEDLALTMVLNLAGSVYLTGAIKDLFCVPRPYSPPIHRLAISNHASEYGFPSTHSATSTNIILIATQLLLQWVNRLDVSAGASGNVTSSLTGWNSHSRFLYLLSFGFGVLVYGFFLIFGRIYCGMHSIQDVMCGSLIGSLVWLINYSVGPILKHWLESYDTINRDQGSSLLLNSSLPVPLIITVVGLALTAAHPQPIDDCPCFEDSTAFVAVSVGVMIGHWSGTVKRISSIDEPSGSECFEFLKLFGVSGSLVIRLILKVVIGMMVIFGWRFTMKEFLSRILPPLFRAFSPLVKLPRRHYNPTTDYKTYRDELQEQRRRYGLRVAIIPSLLHLPMASSSSSSPSQGQKKNQLRSRFTSCAQNEEDQNLIMESLHPALRNRTEGMMMTDPIDPLLSLESKSNDESEPFTPSSFEEEEEEEEDDDDDEKNYGMKGGVKRYDVDVLMRLIVYCGIGLLASSGLPILFFKLGI
ncbi:hypothetical protein PPACK8108_LOCUS4348 [Phakopsora pachyrhizi]|uniref:Phosphatidic acid phosphatase type 2/haloperoxidase domain-containing protein n=1 Tax=Phakopsora pachyrhizi TaxID=170000 RepID=A0AAV0AN64_PHAPC|nr:hypothetical protein PPACK8108_LOCUS4348 [Phakopsora pachyrhizi]